MFRNKYSTFLLSAALFLIGGSAAYAQTAPVAGKIVLKKADNTVIPIADAMVEVFRMDIKSSGPTDKTDKKGQFSFAGLPLGATFVLAVSAPGATPTYLPNVKAGNDKIALTLTEGDGRRLTETEVRTALSGAPTTAASTGKTAEPTADQKKAQAEYEKQVAEITAKNKNVEGKNAIITKAITDGNKAYNEKNYDMAIASYTEGITADPVFVGSAPILLNNRAVVLKVRGIDAYNNAVKSESADKTAALAKARQDLQDSLKSYNDSFVVLKNAAAADITDKANYDKAKYDALSGLTEIYRLLVITKTPLAKPAEAKEAFDAYMLVETDAAKKGKAQITFGEVMLEAGESELAQATFRSALEASPDNPDAMAGLGLSLVNLGYINEEKAKGSGTSQFQEGVNFLQKFAGLAPDTHRFKADAVGLIETLKKQENVTPQKVTTKKRN